MRRLALSCPCAAVRGALPAVAAAAAAPAPMHTPARWLTEHFRETSTPHALGAQFKKPRKPSEVDVEVGLGHAVWSEAEVAAVQQTHKPPVDMVDRAALGTIKLVRLLFDVVSGYAFGAVTERKILRRILFLETIAGVPGMVAGSLRHLRSLRRMQRDCGWIATLLEEAANERLHCLVFMEVYRPSFLFRLMVLGAQGVMWNVFFLAYLLSPRLCHRTVGYLEEEAVRTYTAILKYMDSDDPRHASVRAFAKKPANSLAREYWKLADDATMRDVILAVRADEANHRDVNHTFAGMKPDDTNPYAGMHTLH